MVGQLGLYSCFSASGGVGIQLFLPAEHLQSIYYITTFWMVKWFYIWCIQTARAIELGILKVSNSFGNEPFEAQLNSMYNRGPVVLSQPSNITILANRFLKQNKVILFLLHDVSYWHDALRYKLKYCQQLLNDLATVV